MTIDVNIKNIDIKLQFDSDVNFLIFILTKFDLRNIINTSKYFDVR